MRREPAARAVAGVLDAQRASDEAAEASEGSGRRVRGRAATQAKSAVDDDVVARLAAQAAGQQSLLLSRLVSRDPTKKARTPVAPPVACPADKTREGTPVVTRVLTENAEARTRRRWRAADGRVDAPITVEEFDEKYATNDPMLHYLIEVIVHSKSVIRSEIPRRPECLVDAQQRLEVPEEDVLFLAYHRRPPCGFRNVYWLEFITEDRAIDVEFEYFALSHHGFTHYRGTSVIDFVDVESWVIEKRAFDHMTAMRGLQKLQGLLFFMSWKKKAIRMKHRRVRDRLACSLFQCDPAAARLLVAIRGCCVKIEDIAASRQLPHGTAYTVDHIRQHIRSRIKSTRLEIIEQGDRMSQLIEREIRSLRQQRDAEVEAERLNYSSVSRSSRLLDRLYVFLRLVDLHRFESLSTHMNEFIAYLHTQICGSDLQHHIPLHERTDSSEDGNGNESTEDSITPNRVTSIQLASIGTRTLSSTVSYTTRFSLRHRAIPPPFILGRVIDSVSLGSNPLNTQLRISPAQLEVFDVVYALLNGYVTALDGIPRVLSDWRFNSILAPYTPENREKFMTTLLKPSSQILQDRAKEMKELKYAIDTYYKQLEILESDLLHLAGCICAAEHNEIEKKLSNERSSTIASSLLTASQYEEIRDIWGKLLVEIQGLPRFVQIGVILLDQSSLLNRLEEYVTNHIEAMMEALPDVYKQCLCDLLGDADGRIDRIMNIPTSISDAIQWLKGVMEMMPTHPNRKAFDAKCANLVSLKQLLKDSGAVFRNAEDQDFVKKKDYEWESMYETLMTCFARVQERDSEHRRSVLELNGKADEATTIQLEQVKEDFAKLPPHTDELHLSKHKTRELSMQKQTLIDRLERLVASDGEREEMLELYNSFEIEHRLLKEQNTFDSADLSYRSQKWVAKSPSELLLQHVSVVFDMRAWFCAWVALEEKWLDTPLVNLHPSMILSRLKQFRRRLQFASTRLLSICNVHPDDEDFMSRDHCLVQAIEARVDEMSNDYIIIQAATCGGFSSDRWQLCQGILNMENIDMNAITLRMVKAKSVSALQSVEGFKQLCGVVVLESKLRNATERLRQRMAGCQVVVCFTNTAVLLENIQDVVLELDGVDLETKLLCQARNPTFEGALALHEEIHARLALCSQLLSFQGVWDELCRLSRVHDIDEFFTGQVAWKGPVQRQKKKTGRDELIWGDFVDVGQDWAERLRRLACMSQSSPNQSSNQPKSRDNVSIPAKLACSLDEVQEAFLGFDFELGIAKCELARDLVEKYLNMVRDKCPRLLFLSKQQLIELMVHEDDICTIRDTLSICFPCVSTFKITRGRKEEEDMLQENGLRLMKGNTSESAGSLIIKGVTSGVVEQDFNVPVVKVGRLWFWLTRLEEEMGSLVTENAKLAVAAAFRWTSGSMPFDASYYEGHFPQSVNLALSLVFTSIMGRVIWSPGAGVIANANELHRRAFELREQYTALLKAAVEFAASADGHRLDVRLDSVILLVQYQTNVVDQVHASIQEGRFEEASFVWETQFKVDFIVEDLTAKTARRFRVCDRETWTDCAMLGPSFPVTFLAASGQSEFCVGQELTGMHRIPVITPLTQRCFFEITQALRSHQLSLIAPVNTAGKGGQRTVIQGIAHMLMKPVREVSHTPLASINFERWSNLIKSVVSMGCFLSIPCISQLEVPGIRIILENINQLRQEIRRGFALGHPATPECRVLLPSSRTGCVFAPLDYSSDEGNSRTRQLLFGSTADSFHPVAISLPTVAHFTRTVALLAGYQLTEIPKLKSVFTFFESVSRLSRDMDQKSSRIYRFISRVMHDVSRFRHSCRVLLPANAKWSKKFGGAASSRSGPRGVSKFFRRSADARDVSEIVIDTLFHHVLTVRYKGFLSTLTSTGLTLSDQIIELADQCFPSSKGCELTERATRAQEQALWDAMEMSLVQHGLVTTTPVLEKGLELFEALQTSSVVVVVGTPGAGKSTCIRTLHNALQALEVAELAASDSSVDPNHRAREQNWAKLVCVGSRLLHTYSDEPDERTQRLLGDILNTGISGVDMLPRRWLCVDGVIDASRAEAFVDAHAKANLPTSSSSQVMDASVRIVLETTSLEQASPSFLVQTRVLHVMQMLTPEDIISSWRETWIKKLPFPEESRGYDNVRVVFRMTEVFISGPVQQFAIAEETLSSHQLGGTSAQGKAIWPTYLGMLSLNHLTRSCLQLVTSACLTHRSQLEERSAAQMTRQVAFCVIWGFTGHLGEIYRQKLDQLLCPIVKQLVEMRQANESPEDLSDSERLGDGFWESIHLPLRGVAPPEVELKGQAKSSVCRVVVDSAVKNRMLVVSSASLSQVRVLRLLVHSTVSFMLVGSRGSGKSSLLRLLLAMNAEDQAAESLVDVSLDDRFAPNILDWLDRPRTWFDRPSTEPSNTSQYRPKANDEARLFEVFSAGAAHFVFIDDLAMALDDTTQASDLASVDEFVRVALDHRMAINWTSNRVLPFSKEFAASMTTRQAGTPNVRVPKHTERLLRHFSVFRMPHQDRQHLQGIFRQVYADRFVKPVASSSGTPSTSSRAATTSSDRILSLSEVVLRASVDLAVDVLTVQQTTERLELIDGFTFNLHHLNELLSRSLSFSQLLSNANDSNTDGTGGATLLSLGKLHQCWSSSVRSIFLSPCSHRAPEPVEDDISTVLAIDEVKKVVQSLKLTSEKYFSVPAREDPHAALVTDIVYGVYRYLVDQPEVSLVARAELGELLTTNASASSSSTTRRNGISEGGGTANSGSVMARDEFSVRVARDHVFQHAAHFLSDESHSTRPIGRASRLGLRLHIGSSAGLHQLLHMVHAIRLSSGILVDQSLSFTLWNVFRLAYAMEDFELVELDASNEPHDVSIQAQLEHALLSAGTCGKRMAVMIDLDKCEKSHVIVDMIVAICTGKVHPILYESEALRDEAAVACAREQRELRLLSCDDAVAHFQVKLRRNFRLCVVTQRGSPEGLVKLMRSSAAFQWVSFRGKDVNNPRYRGEVVRQAINELSGQTQATISRQVAAPTSSDIRQVTSWTTLHSLCDTLSDPKSQSWSEDTFLMFVSNVVADCTRRVKEIDRQIDENARLVRSLQVISGRVPHLQQQSQSLCARIQLLSSWHDELQQPLYDLQAQLRDRVAFMQEHEAELPTDEVRAMQRKAQSLETRVWAHRSAMEEYSLAKAEVACRLRELDTELRHWTKYLAVRESIEARSKAHLAESQLIRDAPEKLLQLSADANSLMLDTKAQIEQLNGEPDNRVDEKRGVTGGTDPLVSQLWRSRFPFLSQDASSEQIMSVVDDIHDRIPLVVDRSSLFQYVLVHIFSNIPWFTDGNEEYDRRDAIGYTVTGAVAPMIVQCDGSSKMWRKLHEAVQKEAPVLLVGVSQELIQPLSRFATQHAQRPRTRLLAELTLEAYRSQLKRDVHTPKHSSSNSGSANSTAASQPLDDRTSRRQGVALGDIKTISAALVSAGGVARRGSTGDPKGALARRLSLMQAGGAVAAPKTFGFQMYAVTGHAIDRAVLDATGLFARIEVDWNLRSIKSFFAEAGIRWYDKKLHRDLLDARRIEGDCTYRVLQAEAAIWPIARSPTSTSPSEREEFMVRLEELDLELSRKQTQIAQLPARSAIVESRLKDFEVFGRDMAIVARAVDTFAWCVSPDSSVLLRSHRHFEQLLDTTVAFLLKHDKDSSLQKPCLDWITRVSNVVTNQIVQSVMAALPSASHQRILQMLLASTASESEEVSTSAKARERYVPASLTWLLWGNLLMWSRPIQVSKLTSKTTSPVVDDGSNVVVGVVQGKEGESAPSASATSSASSVGLSVVERLRRKVRVCSLMFDQIGNGKNKEVLLAAESGTTSTMKKSSSSLQSDSKKIVGPSVDQPGSLNAAHKATFRVVTRIARTLWCEWKLAKEDQHADVRRQIAITLGNPATRTSAGGLRKRHHSVKDMTLASTNVTQVVCLDDLVGSYLGMDASSNSSESRTFEEQLMGVMLAKAYFPQLFQSQWDKCVAVCGAQQYVSEMSTSQLFRIDIPNRAGQPNDSASDAGANPVLLALQQLPPSIDVAWRRDDLVHLPTRVLLYEPTEDRTTLEVLLLRVREPTQPSPLRLFSVVAWEECATRIEQQLTASVTSKERFAVEISHQDHFSHVIALVSSIINQHALLCVPEWYIISTLQLFERVQSPEMGYLRLHAIKKSDEPMNVHSHLTHWLVYNGGLSEAEARTAARVFLMQAITCVDDALPLTPLCVSIDVLMSKVKTIAQSGETAAQQRRTKQLLLKELGLDVEERLTLHSVETRELCVRTTKASLEFLGDLLLLPPQKVPSTTVEEGATTTSFWNHRGLPAAIPELAAHLELLCEAMTQDMGQTSSSTPSNTIENNIAWQLWSTLVAGEHDETIRRTRALLQLLKTDATTILSRSRARECAIIRQGIVPIDWLALHFPELSNACLSNVVSVAQVLVLLVSRLGFALHDRSRDSLQTLNLSLLNNPRSVFTRLSQEYAARVGCDQGDVTFVLQPGVVQTEQTESSEVAAIQRGRRQSQQLPRGLDQVGRQSSNGITEKQAVSTCLVVGADGVLCGIQIEGLVAVERVTPQNGGGASHIFIHALPSCRIVCQHRQVDTTQRTTTRDSARATASSRQLTSENATAAQLRQEGVRMTTIASTSAFQTLPDSFWVPSETKQEPDSETLLPRVSFTQSLLVSVPSLARVRPDQDTFCFVLAVPVFPTDDDDQDA